MLKSTRDDNLHILQGWVAPWPPQLWPLSPLQAVLQPPEGPPDTAVSRSLPAVQQDVKNP